MHITTTDTHLWLLTVRKLDYESQYQRGQRPSQKLKEFNDIPFEDIKWIKEDGTELKFSPEEIEDFSFTGLSNISYFKNVVLGVIDK